MKKNENIKAIKAKAESALSECKKVLVQSILELCKETGIEGEIKLTRTLILHSAKPRVHQGMQFGFETETRVCDRILWSNDHCDFFMVNMAGEMPQSSTFMTVDNLETVYEEMLFVLKKGTKQPEKVWIVKQESNDDGEMHFFTQPCKDEATAKSVLQEWKEALLTKHPKYCDAKPYIDGEKDPDDQACCYEWENEDEDSFYIKVLGDDYHELLTIEEKEII